MPQRTPANSTSHVLATSPRARALHDFCRTAITRALLAGTVGALGVDSAGCLKPPADASRDERAAPEPAVPDPGNVAAPDAPAVFQGPLPSQGPPLLHGDTPSFVSTADAAPFPCAVKEPDEAGWKRINTDDAARYRWENERTRAEYDLRARALTPATDVDYLELEYVVNSEGGVRMLGAPPIYVSKLAETGVACGGAHERDTCLAALADLRKKTEAALPCDLNQCKPFKQTVAYTTHGDQVQVHARTAGLRQLLGEIDTPMEAAVMLIAQDKPFGFQCGDVALASHRRLGNGHALMARTWTNTCRPMTEKFLTYSVNTNGRVRLVAQRIASNDPEACIVSGRRPHGLVPLAADESQSAAALLAQMAYLEAASVPAFAALGRSLAALGADARLLARVERARRDEVRHARVIGRMARRFGATLRAPRTAGQGPTTPRALALENAVEGCVRELYGALVAGVQAERARDPALRAALVDVARDELAHAALAWDVGAFLDPLLTAEQRAEVDAARRGALAELSAALSEPSEAQRIACGLPSLREARELVSELERWLNLDAVAIQA